MRNPTLTPDERHEGLVRFLKDLAAGLPIDTADEHRNRAVRAPSHHCFGCGVEFPYGAETPRLCDQCYTDHRNRVNARLRGDLPDRAPQQPPTTDCLPDGQPAHGRPIPRGTP